MQSFISVGVFHEWTLGKLKHGRFTLAPSLEYDYIGARSIDRHAVGSWPDYTRGVLQRDR